MLILILRFFVRLKFPFCVFNVCSTCTLLCFLILCVVCFEFFFSFPPPILVPLPPGRNPFAVNDSNRNNSNNKIIKNNCDNASDLNLTRVSTDSDIGWLTSNENFIFLVFL
jgi:hypothetical protein